ISSADWMPRNFHRRVEVMVPIQEPALRDRLIHEIIGTQRADNQKSWELRADGTYVRVVPPPGEAPLRSQVRFAELAKDRVREVESHIRVPRFSLGAARDAAVGDGTRGSRRRQRGEARNNRGNKTPS